MSTRKIGAMKDNSTASTLGHAQGTEDFLGSERTRGREATPSGAAPTALIHKGDWCGFVHETDTARTRTDGAHEVLICRFAVAEKRHGVA